jgi:hypothetical protein
MIKLSFEYWNALASQLIVISSLLCGFSLSLIFVQPENESNQKIKSFIFKATVIAAAAFLISIFAMTKILMMTTKGFPFIVNDEKLMLPRMLGFFTFITGIFSIIIIITLSGWSKSGHYKWFTVIAGILTLLSILSMMM